MNLMELLICRYLVINARDAMEISTVMHTFIDNTFILLSGNNRLTGFVIYKSRLFYTRLRLCAGTAKQPADFP